MKKISFLSALIWATCLVSGMLFLTSCEKDDDLGLPTPPEVPALIEVGEGFELSYHTYAKGFQVYVSTETAPGIYAWVFKEPVATLYSDAALKNVTGTHYAGPTWKSNSGSVVVASRIEGVTVDAAAIPWLLLGTVSSDGPGVFEETTHIQRVNTFGGKAPTTGADASNVGEEIEIPYTAEYYFYKAN